MKPKMQSAIEKITLKGATFVEEVVEPTFVNFFYGKNGAGKSTIAQTIRTNKDIEWALDKEKSDYDVLLYDTDFIDANFKNYENLAGVFTVNEINIDIQKQVEQLNEDLIKKREDYTKRKNTISEKTTEKEKALTTFQNDCWNKTIDLRKDFDNAIVGKKKSGLFAQEILLIKGVGHSYEELKNLCETIYSDEAKLYSELSRISNDSYTTFTGYGLLNKEISSSSETGFAKFIKALNATDWVRNGFVNYKDKASGSCPYCQQTLPTDFEKDIAACFDAQYQEDIEDISKFQKLFISEMDDVLQVLNNNLSIIMPGLDCTEYKTKLQLLYDAITINKQRIAEKVKEPTTIVTLNNIDLLLIEIDTLIQEYNKKIKANNNIISDIKTKKVNCKKDVWEYLAFYLKTEVENYNNSISGIDKEIKIIEEEMKQLENDGKTLKTKVVELNKQIVNTDVTIDSINKILHSSGFQGFSLQAKKGIQNTYEVIRPDGTVAEKLSEGERNFIAFLYFYNLVRGSLSSEEVKDKIVVIDDPVSSMDSGALFIVSALVREMIEVCYNNTDYRNQKIMGDYIKQIFILTHNVYFHKEITHNQVSKYYSVSFYMIRKTENVSNVILCTRQSQRIPTEQENYNPIQNSYATLWDEYKELKTSNTVKNVIRHILEYYFIQLCGYEGNDLHRIVLEENKELFVDVLAGQKMDYTRYNLADSMLSYMNERSVVISDGLNYIDDGVDVEQCKAVFKLIFEAMHQEQHYKMMMGIVDEEK